MFLITPITNPIHLTHTCDIFILLDILIGLVFVWDRKKVIGQKMFAKQTNYWAQKSPMWISEKPKKCHMYELVLQILHVLKCCVYGE